MEMNEVMNRANCGQNIESALCASSKGTYCSSKRDGLAFDLQRGVDSEHANEKFHLDIAASTGYCSLSSDDDEHQIIPLRLMQKSQRMSYEAYIERGEN